MTIHKESEKSVIDVFNVHNQLIWSKPEDNNFLQYTGCGSFSRNIIFMAQLHAYQIRY